LEAKDDVDQLATFMKANEMDGAKSVHFAFPNDTSDGPQTSNHIAINVVAPERSGTVRVFREL
jgi:hypothetical protein